MARVSRRYVILLQLCMIELHCLLTSFVVRCIYFVFLRDVLKFVNEQSRCAAVSLR